MFAETVLMMERKALLHQEFPFFNKLVQFASNSSSPFSHLIKLFDPLIRPHLKILFLIQNSSIVLLLSRSTQTDIILWLPQTKSVYFNSLLHVFFWFVILLLHFSFFLLLLFLVYKFTLPFWATIIRWHLCLNWNTHLGSITDWLHWKHIAAMTEAP